MAFCSQCHHLRLPSWGMFECVAVCCSATIYDHQVEMSCGVSQWKCHQLVHCGTTMCSRISQNIADRCGVCVSMSLIIAIFVWQCVEDVSHNLANCSPVAQCVWQNVAVCVSWASLVVAWHELQCVMWSRARALSLPHSHAIKYTIHYCAHTTTGLHASFISLISHMQRVSSSQWPIQQGLNDSCLFCTSPS